MAANTLRASELDFEQIKANLKTFYSNQEAFTDYVFEGSALSTLIDLLAYNTHYVSLQANMLANEMFLDSAVSRNSAVSIAKQLDYYPSSYRSAYAIVDITVNNPTGSPASIVLPKNTKFTTTIDGTTYTFVTLDTYEISPVGGVYKFTNIPIFEGTLKTYSYVIDSTNSQSKYVIPDSTVSLDQLKVFVQNSASDLTINRYYESKDLTEVTGTSKVFFIQATLNNQYEVYFGDDILGAALANGNIAIFEYMICNGSAANGAKVFKSANAIAGSTAIAINTITQATGGKEVESIESIRRNAPKAYTAQNRMVTTSDVKTLLPALYSNIKSVSVWGGEDNTPPDYGVVYVSIVPYNYGTLTVEQKNDILTNIISGKKMISTSYNIVDPKYIYLKINSTAYYNPTKSVYDANALRVIVKNAIATYSNKELAKFDGVFRHSKLSAAIDASDKSITSNITKFTIHQYLQPVYGQVIQYNVEFYNPIYKNELGTPENAISSSGFRVTGDSRIFYLEDDGQQYLRRYYLDNTTKIYVDDKAGEINHATGQISLVLNISSIIPAEVGDTGIQFKVKTESFDVIPVRNVILRIKESDITTNVVNDSVASGFAPSGVGYVFTSSR